MGDSGFSYGIGLRQPYAGEDTYFKSNPHVAGMAAEDNKIVLNPYSTLSEAEKRSVVMNEAARIYMRTGRVEPPKFKLSPEQEKAFGSYSKNPQDRLDTVAARILSGDPSALQPTTEQTQYADQLRTLMQGNTGGGFSVLMFNK